MSLDQAVQLVKSNNETDIMNGLGAIINAGSTSANITDILNKDIISLLLSRLTSTNSKIQVRCCWALSNICRADNRGIGAVHKANMINVLPKILQTADSELIEKASWLLTNYSRVPQVQQELAQHPILQVLVSLLNQKKGSVVRVFNNMAMLPKNRIILARAGCLQPMVGLIRLTVQKQTSDQKQLKYLEELQSDILNFLQSVTGESGSSGPKDDLADQVRDELVQYGVVAPLAVFISGKGVTQQQQQMAVNCLVNLSNSEKGVEAIVSEGGLRSVVGLLNSSEEMAEQAAMLLSNLCTERIVREAVRNLDWVKPLIELSKSGKVSTLQQVLRVFINIAFDSHCRYRLQKSNVKDIISGIKNSEVKSLVETACKNISVPVEGAVISEVENSNVESVFSPRAQLVAKKDDIDLAALDDVLASIQNS